MVEQADVTLSGQTPGTVPEDMHGPSLSSVWRSNVPDRRLDRSTRRRPGGQPDGTGGPRARCVRSQIVASAGVAWLLHYGYISVGP